MLISKSECHLCEAAKQTIAAVCGELQVTWQEQLIDDDPLLASKYWELVPVTLIDGVIHDQFRVDANRLRAALSP